MFILFQTIVLSEQQILGDESGEGRVELVHKSSIYIHAY